jgi:putative Mg2+ transporter-C (MgtC) family protein
MQLVQHTMELLRDRMAEVLSSTIPRLLLAAILGGIIGLERELRHRPAGLRTNMFICFGSCLFTVLSIQLAGNPSESTRIASTIVTGIGFIGAGSILHAKGSVIGLTTAATVFVVAGIGMAAGGGLYVTAIFATIVLLISLAVLGRLEKHFELKAQAATYELTGPSTEAILAELNRILDAVSLDMQDVHAIPMEGQSRVVFTVHCVRPENAALNVRLHQSGVFATVQSLGTVDHE